MILNLGDVNLTKGDGRGGAEAEEQGEGAQRQREPLPCHRGNHQRM